MSPVPSTEVHKYKAFIAMTTGHHQEALQISLAYV